MADADRLEIRFEGGEANTGKLHFYEFSRSQYALARFVSTIQYYRLSGKVLERVSSRNYIDIFVNSPKHGSFLSEIIIPIATGAGGNIISIPFNIFFAYIWDLITPKAVENDSVIEQLARMRLAELERDKSISTDRIKQMEIMASVLNEGQQTTQSALEIIKSALVSSNPMLREPLSQLGNVAEKIRRLEYDAARENLLSKHEDNFSKLDSEDLKLLTSRVRPMVPDIGLPLRRSADSISMKDGVNENYIVSLDQARLAQINSRHLDDAVEKIVGVVRMYDRISGAGKFRSHHLLRDLNFKVPLELRGRLLLPILSAMAKQEVLCEFNVMRDESGVATSLILRSIE